MPRMYIVSKKNELALMMHRKSNQFYFRNSIVCLGLICFLITTVNAEESCVISGSVVDSKTGKPIYFVNIFLAYTNFGTTTNVDGRFVIKIKNISNGVYDLVFQHIGYKRKIIQTALKKYTSQQYNIKLKPIALKGQEITVEAREPKEWKKDLKLFIKEFIGTTQNAKHCKIKNTEVLNFHRVPLSKEFTAQTNSLLIVQNNALGYRLKIILDSFKIAQGLVHYKIYPLMEELKIVHKNDGENWKNNRQRTFEGSRKHFLACIYDRNFPKRNKFKIFRAYRNREKIVINKWKDYPLNLGYFSVHPSETMPEIKQLRFNDSIVVTYEKTIAKKIVSLMKLQNQFVLINAFGDVLNPPAISVSDDWAQQRVADTLPLNYIPKNLSSSVLKMVGIEK